MDLKDLFMGTVIRQFLQKKQTKEKHMSYWYSYQTIPAKVAEKGKKHTWVT